MDTWVKDFILFQLHAIFHDAFGFMRRNFGVGPGYVYTLSENLCNNMFLATLRDWRLGFINNCYTGKNITV